MALVLLTLAIIPFTPLQGQSFTAEALGFNVFVEDDFVFGGGDVEGAVAVGNNLTIQQNQGQFAIQTSGTYTISGMSGPAGLVVGNEVNLNGGGLGLLSGAKISIGGTTNTIALSTDQNGASVNTRIVSSGGNYSSTPNINLNHSQSETVYQASPIDFAAAFTTFRDRATQVGNLTTNVTITNANGNTLDPTSISNNSQVYIKSLNPNENILNVSGSNLNKINSITFDVKPSASSYVIINVDKPGTFNWSNFNFTGVSSTEAQYILINFVNATTVNINNSSTVYATIFAPFASVSKNNSANIDGQVIAENYDMTQGGEVHRMYFLGDDPNDTPFPVEWLGVEVVAESNSALIRWETAQETQNSHFTIERSWDATLFEPIAIEASQGEGGHSYAVRDADIKLHADQIAYYRIRQTDMNGSFSYSTVQSFSPNSLAWRQLSLYPNPASAELNLEWPGEEAVRVELYNTSGKRVYTQAVDNQANRTRIDLPGLAAGVYTCMLILRTGAMVERFVIR